MIDWLVVWGGQQLAGFAFKEILKQLGQELGDLGKEAGEDFLKDVFKDSFKSGLSGFKKDALGKALGKAYAQFLYLIQQELELADVSETEIKTYDKPLSKFIRNKAVKQWLGFAFQPNCQKLYSTILTENWSELDLKQLPNDFSWQRISKLYLKRVENIIGESQELKELFSAKKLQEIAEHTHNLTGIIPDYDLNRYRETIQEGYGHLKLSKIDSTYRNQSYQVKLWQIFIPQTVKEALPPSRFDLPKEVLENLRAEKAIEESFVAGDFEQYQQLFLGKPSQSVLDIVNDEKYPYIAFLGDPGSGKSTLLQYLALDWAENPTERIPLLIELRDYAKDESNPKDFLDYFHQGKRKICELNQNQLHEQLLTGKAVVMFDGLDEIFNNDVYGRVIKEIHAFSNKYKQVQIIITSRIVGYNPDDLRNAEFTHFTIEDFNNQQITQFIKNWHQLALPEESNQDRNDTQKRLQTAIKDSPAIRQLAGNPLLLTMMAILNRYKELPRRRIDLYEDATNVLLYQWEIEYKKMELTIDDVDLRAKQGMLREIAYRMQSSEKGLKGNIIHRDDLENAIAEYYYNRLKGTKSRTVAGKIITQLRKRDFILCQLGKDYYGFVHRTFLEYFCAMTFMEKFNNRGLEGGLTIDELKEDVFGKHWQDKTWHEVLRLISGKLNDFVRDVINYLIDIYKETKEVDALILAIECLNEVDSKIELNDSKNQLLDGLKESLENEKQIRKIAKTITQYWQEDSEVVEWLEDIALNNENSSVRQKIAQGIADLKMPYLDNRHYAILDIADVYFYQNRYQKALTAYLRDISGTPFAIEVAITYSYIALKQFEKAIIHCQQWVEKEPKNSFTHANLGNAYRNSGHYQEAEESLNSAVEIAGKNDKLDDKLGHLSSLGWTYRDWGKYERAIETYQCAIKIDSKDLFNCLNYNGLGVTYGHLGQDKKAIAAYKEAIEINPKYHTAYSHLGYFYRQQKLWDKAIENFNTAIELDPFNESAYQNLGLVYLLQDNFSEAEYYFLNAIKINSYDGAAILKLGILKALQGNIEEARINWQKGLKLQGEYGQRDRLFRTVYTIALGEKEQGLTSLQTILTEEKPPVGLLNHVLETANLLGKCPEIEGIDTAITMIKNQMNYES